MIWPELMRGVVPLEIEIPGVRVPEYRICVAPLLPFPTLKKVAETAAPPVEAAKSRFAAKRTVLADTTNAADVRATAART
jgi:hypothetical protein